MKKRLIVLTMGMSLLMCSAVAQDDLVQTQQETVKNEGTVVWIKDAYQNTKQFVIRNHKTIAIGAGVLALVFVGAVVIDSRSDAFVPKYRNPFLTLEQRLGGLIEEVEDLRQQLRYSCSRFNMIHRRWS